MKKEKFQTGILLFVAMILILCISCEDEEKETELGKQAAVEFCDCYQENSLNHCLEKLKSKYEYADYTSNHFISSFNSESSCGVTLEKQYVTSGRANREILIIK